MDPMDAIRQTFFQECEEQLAELESGLLAMQGGARDSETVNAVFRAVHSVKGGAGAFGLDDLVRFAHVFETTLEAVRSDQLVADAHVLKVMLRAADVLADLVRASRDGQVLDESHASASATELASLGGPAAGPAIADDADPLASLMFQPMMVEAAPEPDRWIVRFRPRAEMYAKANDAVMLLRELARLGPTSVSLDASDLPDLATLEPEGAYLAWTVQLQTDQPESSIQEVFEFVDCDCDVDIKPADAVMAEEPAAEVDPNADVMALIRSLQAEVAPEPEPAAIPEPILVAVPIPMAAPIAAAAPPPPQVREEAVAPKPTIRVDLDRVDRLIDLVGELVINGAMLTQRVGEAGISRASAVTVALDELEHLTREIQDSVMAIRAQPVKSVFARMPRLAREVAAMTGKQVRLTSEGEATEVDKTVIEHLADPLTHMIRNAIDHGLESPDVRRAAGKPEEGTVKLQALHRSGRIVIEVSDDGAGINRAKVRESAIAKGLVAPDAVLSDEETDNLIFLPGFSTADKVSDISGRGVGMDVVRRSIQALGGRINIASRPGKGSTFTLSLPLTLAVLDGMVVTVAEQTLIVPLTAIIETLQPRAADIHEMGDAARVIAIRGTYLPLIGVGAALGWADPERSVTGGVALLIEGEDGSRAVLLVDAIQGQRQVVIKSLEANYRRVPGVAAATILGDGRVALILDVDAIVSDARGDAPFAETRAELGLAYA
ncbi:chemotaxis protein CheA [Acidisphaera sp. L21]|uniref:chemotaxis protein CheA n=1 Tax=Acidisphaera sp. L21 TaxID=1641851 RepID=UPI00131A7B89|nr:chemotaxis protein CheA [Acidisphaera sp. L21]